MGDLRDFYCVYYRDDEKKQKLKLFFSWFEKMINSNLLVFEDIDWQPQNFGGPNVHFMILVLEERDKEKCMFFCLEGSVV